MARRRTPPASRGDADRAALDALYAELPAITCRGLCHNSCGPIGMSPLERDRIAAAGVQLPVVSTAVAAIAVGMPVTAHTCPALTALNLCQVYPIRPMICRLWGLVESMPCPHGCRPDGGLLPDIVGQEFMARAYAIGGRPDLAQAIRHAAADSRRAEVRR